MEYTKENIMLYNANVHYRSQHIISLRTFVYNVYNVSWHYYFDHIVITLLVQKLIYSYT